MDVVEQDIRALGEALAAGRVTSVGLVAGYLARIGRYDHHGIRLNAVPILSPEAFEEARAADERRARGETLGPLDGIPYLAKNSYQVRGLPVAAGSPAYVDLIAAEDAFSIERLRVAGAVCLGVTNMPPMANGGMQRGAFGRPESPYNADYLTAAWASGSSSGSGTAIAASFAAFGLGEETWSSGRAPANNNGLVAYTPSWGVISMRGNWPLVPTMDVVVPHTRSVADLLEVLDALVVDDERSRGDFWRTQPWIAVPTSSALRPESYRDLAGPDSLVGKRIGVPRCYLGRGPEAIRTRQSVASLAEAAIDELRRLGAEVVETDFPLIGSYEGEHGRLGGGYQGGLADLGYLPEGYADAELLDLSAFAMDDFLRANADAARAAGQEPRGPVSLAEVDGDLIFPRPPGQLPDEYGDEFTMGDYVRHVIEHGVRPPATIAELGEGVRGLDRARRELYEDWLDELGLDAIVFPASADIAPADADTNQESHDLAWRNGTWVANGNLAIRHLGIPTVTVPMGMLPDLGMPSGLTFAGRAWHDTDLLAMASAYDGSGRRRTPPPRTPELPALTPRAVWPTDAGRPAPELRMNEAELVQRADGLLTLIVSGLVVDEATAEDVTYVRITINGTEVDVTLDGDHFHAETTLPGDIHETPHSIWRPPYGTIVVATASGPWGDLGAYRIVGGV